jgi:hypothetical protein
MVALAALAPVQVIRWTGKNDKTVEFRLSATRPRALSGPIWTRLDGGGVDLPSEQTWYVDDPDAVRKLIEDARMAAVRVHSPN